MIDLRFAAFIMTYERPGILSETIQRLFGQTQPPEKILIVDNSLGKATEELIGSLNDDRLSYHRVGYNAGPAGAAKIGLEILVEEGFDWIYWGDDDDPPRFEDCFEKLLNLTGNKIGAIGAVGSKFNWGNGLRERYGDHELKGLLPVDAIGGGFCFLINAKVIDKETLPDPKLFFGLEEFDFCQKIKKAGYEVCVSGEMLYRYRKQSNLLNTDKKPSILPIKNISTLHRDYYSYRNGIYLMMYRFKKYRLTVIYILRAILKIPVGFIKGPAYGFKNTKFLGSAIIHGVFRKMGKVY